MRRYGRSGYEDSFTNLDGNRMKAVQFAIRHFIYRAASGSVNQEVVTSFRMEINVGLYLELTTVFVTT